MKKIIIIFIILISIGSGCKQENDGLVLAHQKEKCSELGEKRKKAEEEKIATRLDTSEYFYSKKLNTCLWYKVLVRVHEDGSSYVLKEVVDLYSNKTLLELVGVDGKPAFDDGLTSAEFEKKKKELIPES